MEGSSQPRISASILSKHFPSVLFFFQSGILHPHSSQEAFSPSVQHSTCLPSFVSTPSSRRAETSTWFDNAELLLKSHLQHRKRGLGLRCASVVWRRKKEEKGEGEEEEEEERFDRNRTPTFTCSAQGNPAHTPFPTPSLKSTQDIQYSYTPQRI